MPTSPLDDVATQSPRRPPAAPMTLQLAAAGALVALADTLFYGHRLGVSLALFLAFLAGASAWLNRIRAAPARRRHAFIILAAGLVPIIEDVNWLSVVIAVVATGLCARVLHDPQHIPLVRHLLAALRLPFSGILRLPRDLWRANRYRVRMGRRTGLLAGLLGWAFPVLLCFVFISLFVSANPLLERWLSRVDILAILAQLVSGRSIFWAIVLCLIWPVIRLRPLRGRKQAVVKPAAVEAAPHLLDPLSDRTVTRSLILFNALFAVQTAMDVFYLWGGANLPDGMSHATYAHRGAYPLVVTTLLAAAFVLVAMRPAGSGARNMRIRLLVLVWVGQNIMLLLSALLRLDLYVGAYSLTELRVAAFVWMLLVMAGLVLILVQILTRKSIGWLVSANMLALLWTLYAYSLVDTAVVIANFNFRHSYEMRGEGQRIDTAYLASLGPGVIPAIDRYAPRILASGRSSPPSRWQSDGQVFRQRNQLAGNLPSQEGWRSWNFRAWRLSRYLDKTATAQLKATLDLSAAAPEGR